ncbi:hypothetical protein AB0J74_18580 [Asanoa sp. NPDC049573]
MKQVGAIVLAKTNLHGLGKFTIDGQTVDAFHVSSTTVPFNLTGLPALSA